MTGRVRARLPREPLDVSDCLTVVADPGCGGVGLFIGVVRDHDAGRPVDRLEYQAHPHAADALASLCMRAVSAGRGSHVAIDHRLGMLTVGELAVVVAVSAPHRAEALDTCRWLIDTLKTEIPIWKAQHYRDGAVEWVGCP